jgi:hypothetical protein
VSETVEKVEKKGRATKLGRVVSDKMNKTIVVEVERRVQHAEYTRTIKRTTTSRTPPRWGTASGSRRRGRCRG